MKIHPSTTLNSKRIVSIVSNNSSAPAKDTTMVILILSGGPAIVVLPADRHRYLLDLRQHHTISNYKAPSGFNRLTNETKAGVNSTLNDMVIHTVYNYV